MGCHSIVRHFLFVSALWMSRKQRVENVPHSTSLENWICCLYRQLGHDDFVPQFLGLVVHVLLQLLPLELLSPVDGILKILLGVFLLLVLITLFEIINERLASPFPVSCANVGHIVLQIKP